MAAVNAEISLDELRKFVPKFVNATTKEVGQELIRQAGLMVRGSSGFGLISLTPPRGLDEARQIGERSVAGDVYKVFVSQGALIGAMKAVSDRRTVSAFRGYIRRGEYENAKDFVNGQKSSSIRVRGYRAKRHGKTVDVSAYTQSRDVSALNIPRLGNVQSISNVPSAMLHKMRRRKGGEHTGRVIRESWAQVVLRKPALEQYIKDRQQRVGLLKAGWAKAARGAGLRVSIPKFVLRNEGQAQGKGIASFGNPLNMSITLINSFQVASSKIERGDIDFIISTRQDNITKEMEHRMSKISKAA
jgi:hypothetical protein